MTSAQVIVDGLLTQYYQAGDGAKTVVFLHGWGDSAQTFAGLAADLAPHWKTIAVDLPGFGKTNAPNDVWGLDDYATFVADFLAKLEIMPEVIVGHSNGGAIAIRGLANGDLNTHKLVLLASAGIRDTYQGRKKALRLAAKGAKLLTAPLPQHLRDKVKKRAYKSVGSDLFVAEHMQETFKRIITDDIQNDALAIKVATLLIYGSEDTATPVGYGQIIHEKIVGSRLEVINGSGHFIHHDASTEVNQLVTEFLR